MSNNQSSSEVDVLDIDEHKLSVDEVCERYQTDLEKGLSTALVQINEHKYGRNEIKSKTSSSICYQVLKHILQGVSSIMVAGSIVCLMAVIADVIGNTDSNLDMENLFFGLVLSFFICVTGVFSYLRERMAQKILRKSVSLITQDAYVIRDGKKETIHKEDVVVGDLVELKYGDEVPADVRVVQSIGYKVDSAPLTGLTEPKSIKVEYTHLNALITQNLLFASTYGLEGYCRGIVIRVGDNSLIGRIAGITSQLKEKQTPLSRDVTLMVLTFTSVGLIFGMICWVAAMRLDYSWSSTTVFFVGVCVAIVPESLLYAITVCHSVAGKRMIKKRCITRHFDSIENLGATSVLCLDKTGTLTQNKLSVCAVWAGETLTVANDIIHTPDAHQSHTNELEKLFQCIVLTSKATLEQVKRNETIDYEVKGGEPMNVSLLKFALTSYPDAVLFKMKSTQLFELPFNYRTFHQLSIHLEDSSKDVCCMAVRGAPERVFTLCSTILIQGKETPVTEDNKKYVDDALFALGALQQRVVGFCDKRIPFSKDLVFSEEKRNYPTSGYRFLGLVAFSDPSKPGVIECIKKLRSACIKVVMLTGDHPTTATSLAKAIGIISKHVKPLSEMSTENEISIYDDPAEEKTTAVFTESDLREIIQKGKLGDVLKEYKELVFARLSPEQKAVIVEAYQEQGELVTMVGDGINDCAALRAADTSVALGIGSSQAAKEISDIVLLDNNLLSLITGIEEGRLVFENMTKCFAFTITSNIPEILPFVLFLFLGIPLPISPISILILTIGVDMFPAIALAYELPEWDLMKFSKRVELKQHKIFSSRLLERAYARIGIIQFAAAMLSYAYVMTENGFHLTSLLFVSQKWYSQRVMTDAHGQEWTRDQREHIEDVAQTAYFFAVTLTQLAHLIGCKTRRESIFHHGMKNWRLNFALLIPFILTLIIVNTQILHIVQTSRIERMNWRLLLPPIPFAIFIFVYDELRRLLIRKYPESWIAEYLYY